MNRRKKTINFGFAMDDLGNRASTTLRDGSGDVYVYD